MKRITLIWLVLALAALSSAACALPSLASLRPEPTDTPRPTRTPRPTFTATPTDTPPPTRTATPTATNTPLPPTATNTPPPTNTPLPTDTPAPPTATRRPPPTNTPAPPPPPPPTATPAQEFTGSLMAPTDGTYSCNQAGILVRVVDRAGKPIPGLYVHVGHDGAWSKWTTATTTESKPPYGYNADFSVSAAYQYYVTLFRVHDPTADDYDESRIVSNSVTVRIDELNEQACADSNGKNDGTNVRLVGVQFVYNR